LKKKETIFGLGRRCRELKYSGECWLPALRIIVFLDGLIAMVAGEGGVAPACGIAAAVHVDTGLRWMAEKLQSLNQGRSRME
jgi:hypothetical protein